MTLLVDVNIAAENLVKAAWARAIANRERMRREQELKALRDKETAKGKNRRVEPFSLLSNYRPDEPAAFRTVRREEPTLLASAGFFFWKDGIAEFESAIEEPVERFYVWSGDGSSSVFVARQALAAVATLPLGNRSAIFVVQWESGGKRCFYVDTTSVRVVPTPAAVASTDIRARVVRPLGFAVLQVPDVDPLWLNGDFGDASDFFLFPSLFPSFPSAPTFPSYAFMRSLVPGVPEFDQLAIYSNFGEFTGANNRSFTAQINSPAYRWTGDDPSTNDPLTIRNVPFTDPRWSRDAVVSLSAQTPFVPLASTFIQSLRNQYFWNWDQPDYCRDALLALGFETEDLLPP